MRNFSFRIFSVLSIRLDLAIIRAYFSKNCWECYDKNGISFVICAKMYISPSVLCVRRVIRLALCGIVFCRRNGGGGYVRFSSSSIFFARGFKVWQWHLLLFRGDNGNLHTEYATLFLSMCVRISFCLFSCPKMLSDRQNEVLTTYQHHFTLVPNCRNKHASTRVIRWLCVCVCARLRYFATTTIATR